MAMESVKNGNFDGTQSGLVEFNVFDSFEGLTNGQNVGKLMTRCVTFTEATDAKAQNSFGRSAGGGVTNNFEML